LTLTEKKLIQGRQTLEYKRYILLLLLCVVEENVNKMELIWL